METIPLNFPKSYQDHLRQIADIKFTSREVEIIAFIVNGRSAKKIASFFSISPRTVENHIRHIMEKLPCNSREGILDFIEKSGKFLYVKRYYLSLLIHTEFEAVLKRIASSNNKATCSIVHWPHKEGEYAFLPQLKAHLKFAGVKASYDNRQQQQSLHHLLDESQNTYKIYLLPRSILEEFDDPAYNIKNLYSPYLAQRTALKLFIFPSEKGLKEMSTEQIHFDSINLDIHQNYYLLVFEILKRFFPKQTIEGAALAFQNKMATLTSFPDHETETFRPPDAYLPIKKTEDNAKIPKLLRKRESWVFCILMCLGLSSLWFQYFHNPDKLLYFPQERQQVISSKPLIRSDFVIPGESIFLERSDLLDQIKERFNKYPSGIQAVAIVGVGGAGKTTLARQYARLQEIPIAWEINAETRETIFNSFESLAYALCKTENERKAVKGFQDIKGYAEKEDKLIQWVSDHLKLSQRWLLIYDNVISFKNIRKYFPSDKNAWGSGQIIITTRNSHMENNNFVDHVLPIKELDADQKLSLFNKIYLNHAGQTSYTSAKIQETRDFLKEIPSFPLDVTVAAYYLKTTNIPYEKYLGYLKSYNEEFENIQKDILKEASEYNQTRYGIITLSLKEIIEAHQDFKELLLLISLLDSQNIPRDLLTAHKNDLIVDKFTYFLKRYSLISTQTSPSIPSLITFSIHRSTQSISLLYLTNTFNLVNGQKSLMGIANSITNHIGNVVEEENIDMMKILIPHCEAFRSHHKSLLIPKNLTGALGCMYLYLGNYLEAKKLLLISLNGLNPDEAEKSLWSIRALTYLGAAHVSLGEYEAAKNALKQSVKGYQHYFPKSYAGYAQALRYLATAYRDTGDYETARKLFEESLNIYQKHLPHLYVGMGRALGYVGDIYRELGKFEEARMILEQSFDLHAKYFPENPLGILWNFAPLGDVYIILGEYAKAQELLKRGLDICREYLPENHAYHPWLSGCLGLAHSKLGQYEEAKICLEKSAALFAGNRVYYAWAIRCLGAVYGELGNYEKSISLLQESLEISEKYFGKDHLEGALILTSLARVYLLKNQLDTAHNLIDRALRILEKNKHPELHVSLETLADIYLQKSLQFPHQGDKLYAKRFKKKAINALNKALMVVNTHFQENVVHKNRILQKLKSQ